MSKYNVNTNAVSLADKKVHNVPMIANKPVTKELLLRLIDRLTVTIEEITVAIEKICTDGIILEGDQIDALKARVEQKRNEIRAVQKIIQRLRTNETESRKRHQKT
jgi:hypothetical protein